VKFPVKIDHQFVDAEQWNGSSSVQPIASPLTWSPWQQTIHLHYKFTIAVNAVTVKPLILAAISFRDSIYYVILAPLIFAFLLVGLIYTLKQREISNTIQSSCIHTPMSVVFPILHISFTAIPPAITLSMTIKLPRGSICTPNRGLKLGILYPSIRDTPPKYATPPPYEDTVEWCQKTAAQQKTKEKDSLLANIQRFSDGLWPVCSTSYPSLLGDLCQHCNDWHSLLVDDKPEVIDCLRQRSL